MSLTGAGLPSMPLNKKVNDIFFTDSLPLNKGEND